MADKKKNNVFKRIAQKFKDVVAEGKRVVWPDKTKLKATSAVVLLVILFFAVYLTLIGSGGRWLLDKVGFYDTVETEETSAGEETTTAEKTTVAEESEAETETEESAEG